MLLVARDYASRTAQAKVRNMPHPLVGSSLSVPTIRAAMYSRMMRRLSMAAG